MRTAQHDGLLVLDKPVGVSSRTAVNRVQTLLPRGTRIGHAGTLDPLASGVLVLSLGRATRLIEYVQDMSKEYLVEVWLGVSSTTDDAEGVIAPVAGTVLPSVAEVSSCVATFVGVQQQVPPAFSAARVVGRRAYKLARRGHEVTLAPRPVRIDAIEILDCAPPLLRCRVRCGKGTYIRALARDLGARLGCGGHVHTLRRTRVGAFQIEMAHELSTLTAVPALLPLATALAELPALTLPHDALQRLMHGQLLPWPELALADAADVAVFAPGGVFAGIARWRPELQALKAGKMMARDVAALLRQQEVSGN